MIKQINFFVKSAKKDFQFYKNVFGAVEQHIPDDHLEKDTIALFKVGNISFGIVDESPDEGRKSAASLESTPIAFEYHTNDVLDIAERALAAGGKYGIPSTSENPIFITPDGKEVCNIVDLSGYYWSICKER